MLVEALVAEQATEIIDVVAKQAAEQVAAAIKSLPPLLEAPAAVTFYTVTENVSPATENVDFVPPSSSPPPPDAMNANRKAVQAPPPSQPHAQANEELTTNPPLLAAGKAAPPVIEDVIVAHEPPPLTPAWPGHYLPQDYQYHHHHPSPSKAAGPGLAQTGGLHLGSVSDTPPRQLDLNWVESGSESKKKKKRGGKKKKNSEHESVKLHTSARTTEEEEYRADFEAWQMKTYGMIYQ